MKKLCRIFLATALLMALLASAAVPALADNDFNFHAAIDAWLPNAFNDRTLTVGQTHTPTAAVWAADGTCYTSDPAVVAIDAQGTVTAVGEGRAYIAIVSSTGMYEVIRYTVSASVSTEPTSPGPTLPIYPVQTTPGTSPTQAPTDAPDETAAPTAQNRPTLPTVATQNTVTQPTKAPTKATKPTYNSYWGSNDDDFDDFDDFDFDDFDDDFGENVSRIRRTHRIFNCIFWPFFFLILFLVIFIWISTFRLSRTSMRTRILPMRCRTANTVTKPLPPRTVCPKCGRPFGESNFCPECGVSKFVQNTFVFPIDGKITAQKFETQFNQWLAENPYIYNCKLSLDTHQSLFRPFVQHKFFIKKAVLTFSVSDKPVAHQYAFAFAYKFRLFGPIGYNEDKLVAKWQANNPGTTVLASKGGRIQHWDSNGGFYAQYYGYIFYQK